MAKQRISYVPLDKMDAKMLEEAVVSEVGEARVLPGAREQRVLVEGDDALLIEELPLGIDARNPLGAWCRLPTRPAIELLLGLDHLDLSLAVRHRCRADRAGRYSSRRPSLAAASADERSAP